MDIPHETYVIRLAQRLEMQLLDLEPEAVKGASEPLAAAPCRVAYAKRLPPFSSHLTV
jgi:hypothetical protein